MGVNRRTWLALLVAVVVIFVLSNVPAKNSTASNVLWVIFLIGVLLLIVLGVFALVRSRLAARGR